MELKVSDKFKSEILELSKKASTERITTSRKVTSKPCWVMNVLTEPSAAGNLSEVKLINGETSLGEVKLYFKEQYAHPSHSGSFPIYFNRGLFCALVTGADGCSIQYYVEPRT